MSTFTHTFTQMWCVSDYFFVTDFFFFTVIVFFDSSKEHSILFYDCFCMCGLKLFTWWFLSLPQLWLLIFCHTEDLCFHFLSDVAIGSASPHPAWSPSFSCFLHTAGTLLDNCPNVHILLFSNWLSYVSVCCDQGAERGLNMLADCLTDRPVM